MNSRYLKIGAFFSILLNFLLLGLILGSLFSDKPHHRRDHPPGSIHTFLKDLPQEKSKWFLTQSRKSKSAHFARHKAMKKLRSEAISALTAEPFDSVLFKQRLIELNQLRGGLKDEQTLMIVQLAKKLSKPERQALSTHLLQDREFYKRHRAGKPKAP
jgi:uncharacterized membrane protein